MARIESMEATNSDDVASEEKDMLEAKLFIKWNLRKKTDDKIDKSSETIESETTEDIESAAKSSMNLNRK